MQHDADVIVVGGGNAGFSAAHAAAERGRSVIVLERGEGATAGGNSFFTAGATRIAHEGLPQLQEFVEADDRHATTTVPPYSAQDYLDDLERVTEGRNDAELSAVLVDQAQPTLRWLAGLGLRYRLRYERPAYARPDGRFLFWGCSSRTAPSSASSPSTTGSGSSCGRSPWSSRPAASRPTRRSAPSTSASVGRPRRSAAPPSTSET